MPNHIAELESTVAQLNATVDGLRDELVDANERIRALERELETDTDENPPKNESFLLPPPPPQNRETNSDDEESEPEQNIDDIIVA